MLLSDCSFCSKIQRYSVHSTANPQNWDAGISKCCNYCLKTNENDKSFVENVSIFSAHYRRILTCHLKSWNRFCICNQAVKERLCPSRPVSSVHSASTSVVHKTSTLAGDQSQPIVISDTPSPAVSIITIHSDSEDEDDRKFPAAWWAHFLSEEFEFSPVLFLLKRFISSPLILSCSSGTSQRTNVISCVTVHDSHDSDSSTSTPLSPKTTSQPTKSLAIIMPSVKSQLGESTTHKAPAATGNQLCDLQAFAQRVHTLLIKLITAR